MRGVHFSRRKKGATADSKRVGYGASSLTTTHGDLHEIIDLLHSKTTLKKQDISSKIKVFKSQLHCSFSGQEKTKLNRENSNITMLKKEIEYLDKENLNDTKFPMERSLPDKNKTLETRSKLFCRPLRSVEMQLNSLNRSQGSQLRCTSQDRISVCRFNTPKKYFRGRARQTQSAEPTPLRERGENMQLKCEVIAPFRKYFQPRRTRKHGSCIMRLNPTEPDRVESLAQFTQQDFN